MKPTAYRILAERIEEETKTPSGILLSKPKKTTSLAKVIDVGANIEHVKKGDTIAFEAFTEDAVTIDNKELLFIKEEDVQAIIEY